jgi:predicted HAD superfamily Cof-like phosphohydrolase
MPTAHYDRVREFMQRAGQQTPDQPTVPDPATRVLRAKLIVEEALETVAALGVELAVVRDEGTRLVISRNTDLSFEAAGKVDLEGVVDGCADISVVTMGTLIAFGVDDDVVLQEVDQANLRKFAPGSYRREDGKWMKPPDWRPPDILGAVERAGLPSDADR